jgi:hypothetical protein
MTGRAPQALADALREEGPPVLRTAFVHGTASESRLQLAPDEEHNSEHDPHKEGRALDIVLLASDPAQKAEGDELVALFRRMVDVMQWGWLIYNKRQWGPNGEDRERIFRAINPGESPAKYALAKAKHEHITHIHIEWNNNKKDLDDFKDALLAELTSEEGDLLATIDAVPATLAGIWDVTIGDWSGVFKFTRGGGVSWLNDASDPKPGGTGWWSVGQNRALSWRFGNGDIRTFAVELPLDTSGTNGSIFPQGQGWFSMSKR